MLMRFDPLGGLERIAEELQSTGRRNPRSVPMDAYRRGEDVVLRFDLPGVDPESIDLTVDQHVLTVRAERQSESQEGDEVLAVERPQGSFVRRVFLGDTLDTDRISAQYRNGVLELTIPISERAKPRKIEIGNAGENRPVETATDDRQPVAAGA
jgi:HSP20 family protein